MIGSKKPRSLNPSTPRALEALLCVICEIAFPFSAGELGEARRRRVPPLCLAVERRRREVSRFTRRGLVA